MAVVHSVSDYEEKTFTKEVNVTQKYANLGKTVKLTKMNHLDSVLVYYNNLANI